LDGIFGTVEKCKLKILDAICSDVEPFVHYDGPPTQYPELSEVYEVAPHIWRLPKKAPAAVVLSWLHMGNWQRYVSDAPINQLRDLCRATDSEVEEFVRDSGVAIVIDSFHDDASWVVAVRPEGRAQG
jgi:hypothetical protein